MCSSRAAVIGAAAVLCATTSAIYAQSDTAQSNVEKLPTLSIEADTETPIGQVEHADFAGRYTRITGNTLERTDSDPVSYTHLTLPTKA